MTRGRIGREFSRNSIVPHPNDPSLRSFIPVDPTSDFPIQNLPYGVFSARDGLDPRVGVMFRGKDNALQPNWLHMPIGYNGRASTVVVSGTKVKRPRGQLKPPTADVPSFGPCRRLDFELEMGVVVGQASAIGEMLTEK